MSRVTQVGGGAADGNSMARLIAVVLMLVGIYVGLTVYTEGSDRAFGGLLAGATSEASDAAATDTDEWSPEEPAAPSARVPITQRVREKAQGAVDARFQRTAEQ